MAKRAVELVADVQREAERRWGSAEVEADFIAGRPPVVRARPAPEPEEAPAWMWRRGLAPPPKR